LIYIKDNDPRELDLRFSVDEEVFGTVSWLFSIPSLISVWL
jgi:hypothetical protein